MTIPELTAALRAELRDRRILARHARRLNLQMSRRWHLEIALAARRQIRAMAAA